MSNLSTLPKGDSAWLFRKALERIIKQVSVLETNIGASTTGNSANTQVIFNDNGVLRGDSDFIFNAALNKLVALNIESTAALVVGTTATITGDLTVDTSTLKVDSANDRVGIGTASPAVPLHLSAGIYGEIARFYDTSGNGISLTANASSGFNQITSTGTQPLLFSVAGSVAARIDSSGNLGLGVTPSAWATAGGYVAMQVGGIGLYGRNAAGNELDVSSNGFYSSAGWKYITTSTATRYAQQSGQHQWFNAPSGTAGNAITFTQAMTLDSSGRLGIGTVSPAYSLDVVGGANVSSYLRLGSNPSTTGDIRLSNGVFIVARNAANSANVSLLEFNSSNSLKLNEGSLIIDSSGNTISFLTGTAPSLATNSQMVFNLTSNTNLRISVRGTDGTTRTANITLA